MKTTIALFALAALVGCASQQTQESTTSAAAQPASTSQAASARPGAARTSVAAMPVQAKTVPDKRSIYYEYDKSEIAAEGKKLIEAHSDYLRAHPEAKIRIEGNADERGSAEYNLALGQRRADAVMKIMTLLGVSEERIETVSFGKEKPKASGHNESSWSENRRSDIVYR